MTDHDDTIEFGINIAGKKSNNPKLQILMFFFNFSSWQASRQMLTRIINFACYNLDELREMAKRLLILAYKQSAHHSISLGHCPHHV